MSAEKASQVHPIIAFRAEPDLHAWADGQAAMEGISRSDVARRALIRDRQRQQAEESHIPAFLPRRSAAELDVDFGKS